MHRLHYTIINIKLKSTTVGFSFFDIFFSVRFVPSGCDDIIRQHKAACLRVTSLLAVKDLLWIGTSAGVVLTMTIPAVVANTGKLVTLPVPIGQYLKRSVFIEMFEHSGVFSIMLLEVERV